MSQTAAAPSRWERFKQSDFLYIFCAIKWRCSASPFLWCFYYLRWLRQSSHQLTHMI